MKYVYYRAMPLKEANELVKNNTYTNTKRNNGITWWCETLADVSRYTNTSRVIVRIILDRPLSGRQVAEFTDAKPHIEYRLRIEDFNKHLCDLLEDIMIV